MRKFISALVGAFLLCTSAAQAVVIINYDGGGVIEQYIQKYQTIRASGDTVVIDGPCASACTLVLSIIPPERVCSTANGWYAFHSASYRDADGARSFAPSATKAVYDSYPKHVRYLLALIGWYGQDHPELVWVTGQNFSQPCIIEDGVARVPNQQQIRPLNVPTS